MRFGAVFRYRKSYGAVRCCNISYDAVRCGSPLNGLFYGAAPLSVGKTVQYRFFSAVHRINKPYKTAVSYGSRAFSRARTKALFFCCFSTVYRINKPYKPAGAYGFLSFFYLQAKSSATTGRRRVKNRLNKSIRTYRSSVKNKYQVKIT